MQCLAAPALPWIMCSERESHKRVKLSTGQKKACKHNSLSLFAGFSDAINRSVAVAEIPILPLLLLVLGPGLAPILNFASVSVVPLAPHTEHFNIAISS